MRKVALFVGSDIMAHLILNDVVKDMVEKYGMIPVLYFPKHPFSKRAQLPELQEGAFYERTLINETVYPFINQRPHSGAKKLTPQQLADKYDLEIGVVENVNAPDFVEAIRGDNSLIGAVSIRCFQIFQADIIDTVKTKGFFLNLHPGLLPEYRGVMSTAWRMYDIATGKADTADFGCTLHKIDQGIDTGKILWPASLELNGYRTVFEANIKVVPFAAGAISQAMKQVADGGTLYGHPQDASHGVYRTYPTAKQAKSWNEAGVVLTEKENVFKTLVEAFSRPNTAHCTEFVKTLDGAVHTWELKKSKPAFSTVRKPNHPENGIAA